MDILTTAVTYEGERWDQLCNRAYGLVTGDLMKGIIGANPSVGITDRLEGGMVLVVPVIDGQVTSVDKALVAPWKR